MSGGELTVPTALTSVSGWTWVMVILVLNNRTWAVVNIQTRKDLPQVISYSIEPRALCGSDGCKVVSIDPRAAYSC